jgi:hypothetical protein
LGYLFARNSCSAGGLTRQVAQVFSFRVEVLYVFKQQFTVCNFVNRSKTLEPQSGFCCIALVPLLAQSGHAATESNVRF